MANRPQGYGLTAEVKGKMAEKYDVDMEQKARVWMEAVLGEPLNPDVPSTEPLGVDRFQEALKTGVFLCKFGNKLIDGANIKFSTGKMSFKQMENIGNFLAAAESYGIPKFELFQTVDLFEAQNMWQVVLCIHSLGRKAKAKGYSGPALQ